VSNSDADFEFVRKLIYERSAIVLEPSKAYLVDARLTPIVRREGLASLGDLVARLRAESFGELHRTVVEAMTTNETTFFRDVHPFDALKRHVVPSVLSRKAQERTLNVWCAACSSGQEPYSIAMLLRESFPQLASWTIQIIATDLSNDILERAKRGVYSQLEVNRGLPAVLLVRHFKRQGVEWQVSDDLRAMVTFRPLNLIESWPLLPRMDVIFLRNVLIYFDVDTKKAILAKVRRVLHTEGYLFLGGAETTTNLDETFERVQFEKSGCYRLREKVEPRRAQASA
jgi:chemotaxis protein methyltransferase CheR